MPFSASRPCVFHSSIRFLACLINDLIFLELSLFSTELLVGLVARRGLSGFKALLIKAYSLLMASSLFASCERSRCETTTSIPSDVIFDSSFFWMSSFSSSSSNEEFRTLKCTSTFELTLFTFCPPGPLLREVKNCNSEFNSGMTNIL